MKKSLFVFALMLVAMYGYAQDIRTAKLTWTITSLNDLNTNKTSTYSCAFETNGQQAIVWRQKNGTYTSTLSVMQLTGNWADVQTNGQVVYTIALDGETGTLTFERIVSGAFITIDLSQPSGGRLKHKYLVGQVTTF
jgi:archaellum component FlaF (FlaF/FlaG flagellin family)